MKTIIKVIILLIASLSIASNTTDFLIKVDYPFFSQFFCLNFVVLFASMWILTGNLVIFTKKMFYSICSLLLQLMFSITFLYLIIFFNFSFVLTVIIAITVISIPLVLILLIAPKLKSFKINLPLAEENDMIFKNTLQKTNFLVNRTNNGTYIIQDGKYSFVIYLIKDSVQLVIHKNKFHWKSKWNNEYTSAHSWILSHYSLYKKPYIIVVNPYGKSLQLTPLHLEKYSLLMLNASSQEKAADALEHWIDYIAASNQ